MKLVHIPTTHIPDTYELWWPFVVDIAKRLGVEPLQVADELRQGVTHAHLVADGKQAKALAGTRFEDRGTGVMYCHLVWCTGEAAAEWFHLIAKIEEWAKRNGCARLIATARPGWSRMMKSADYRMTHVVYEKELV